MAFTPDEFLENLQEVDVYEFEQFIAELWEMQDWDTYVTQGADDGGVDVVVEQSTPFPKKQVIQVKRYEPSSSVGRPDIQQYASLRQERTDVDTVVVVTTGRFTDGAEEVARKLNVKLIDGPQLYHLIDALDAFEVAQSYIDPVTGREGVDSTVAEGTSNDQSSQKAEGLESSQSIIGFNENTESGDIPRGLPSLIRLREGIASTLQDVQSELDSAEEAFREERYFDAVEYYDEVNGLRRELRRNIARYDAGLTYTDGGTLEHLPSAETFTTRLAQMTDGVDEHFQEAFQIVERAKGLELLAEEIRDRLNSIEDSIEEGDKMRQSADVEHAHSKYEHAKVEFEEVQKTMDIYRGLVSTYDDAVTESHQGLSQDISLSELEAEITSKLNSKGELLDRQDVAEEAAGSFNASVLTDNSGELFDKDLIEYVREDEQLEFVFDLPRKGFRTISPQGNKQTPDHDVLRPGSSFLAITDKRILYIAGVEDHDEVQAINYEQLSDVTASTESTSRSIQFTSEDGTTYIFEGMRNHVADIMPAATYVSDQLR
jgi:predicted nuclease with TOPRIM domain